MYVESYMSSQTLYSIEVSTETDSQPGSPFVTTPLAAIMKSNGRSKSTLKSPNSP